MRPGRISACCVAALLAAGPLAAQPTAQTQTVPGAGVASGAGAGVTGMMGGNPESIGRALGPPLHWNPSGAVTPPPDTATGANPSGNWNLPRIDPGVLALPPERGR